MKNVKVSSHAICRYAERALNIDIASYRKLLAAKMGDGYEPTDWDVIMDLDNRGLIDRDAIECEMVSKCLPAIKFGCMTVILPEGRIIMTEGGDAIYVVTFKAKDMTPKNKRSRYFKGGRPDQADDQSDWD